MLEGHRIYDADAHVMMSPRMWETLPKEYRFRRPRPVRFGDADDLGGWKTAWLLDGRLDPHPFGPGTHASNIPSMTMEEYGAKPDRAGDFSGVPQPIGVVDLSNPEARLRALDDMGIDVQFLFPSTSYAATSIDPGLEAALFRAYNRYVGAQCKQAPTRLKWAGLLPLREPRQAVEAVHEMQKLGASAAVVFGTAGEQMLSDPAFTPVWDEFARSNLPLCVHMGMSYPPFEKLCFSIQDANMIGKALPAQLAFVAVVGHGMLDRYPNLRVAFLEFGGEWIFYSVGRMQHYVEVNRKRMADPTMLPRNVIEEYLRSGRIFLGVESDDRMLSHELALLGDGQILYSSDFPHGEGRDEAAIEIIGRNDISADQKRKILYENAVRFFGAP
jgi:predicted TIM-barrel fold metal-dependent hydrolase